MKYNPNFKKLPNAFFGISYKDLAIVLKRGGDYVLPLPDQILFCYFNGNWRVGNFYVLYQNDDILMECHNHFDSDSKPLWNPREITIEQLKNNLNSSMKLPTVFNIDDNYDKYTKLAREYLDKDNITESLFYSFLGAKNDILKEFKRLIFSLSSTKEKARKGKKLYLLYDLKEGQLVFEYVKSLPEEDYEDDFEQITYIFWLTEKEVKRAIKNRIIVELMLSGDNE